MWVAVEFPARISKVNAEFPVLLHFRTPLLLLMTHHEKTWLNESFTVVLTLTLGGGGTRECNSTKFPVQGWQAWWKPVSSRIFMLRVKQQISFHQLFDIGKDINFSNCYGLEMTPLAKKHHTVQKNIHNSAKTFDILLK